MLVLDWKKKNLHLSHVGTGSRNERPRKSVRNPEEGGNNLLDLLEVNAVKENNCISVFFFKTGKRLNKLLVLSLCAKMNS